MVARTPQPTEDALERRVVALEENLAHMTEIIRQYGATLPTHCIGILNDAGIPVILLQSNDRGGGTIVIRNSMGKIVCTLSGDTQDDGSLVVHDASGVARGAVEIAGGSGVVSVRGRSGGLVTLGGD